MKFKEHKIQNNVCLQEEGEEERRENTAIEGFPEDLKRVQNKVAA